MEYLTQDLFAKANLATYLSSSDRMSFTLHNLVCLNIVLETSFRVTLDDFRSCPDVFAILLGYVLRKIVWLLE